MSKRLKTDTKRRVGIDICNHHGIEQMLTLTVGGWVTAQGMVNCLQPYMKPGYKLAAREIAGEPPTSDAYVTD